VSRARRSSKNARENVEITDIFDFEPSFLFLRSRDPVEIGQDFEGLKRKRRRRIDGAGF